MQNCKFHDKKNDFVILFWNLITQYVILMKDVYAFYVTCEIAISDKENNPVYLFLKSWKVSFLTLLWEIKTCSENTLHLTS